MGNCNSLNDRRKRSDEVDDQRLHAIETPEPTHDGIKTVPVEKVCEFSTGSVLCICIVTWNMNGKLSSGDFEELVGRDRKFDLLVVGLQEAPRRSVRQMLEAAIEETHSLIGEATMKSLQLFLFGQKNAVPYLRDIKVDNYAVGGLGGLIGRKKGAVAIYINFNGICMVFISCHLSAHAHKVEKRNSQCEHISDSLFSADRKRCPRPCHLTVWLGDLNYRIEGISNQPARRLIRKNLHSALVSKDQLLQEAERGQVFSGYCEGTLSFKPTYKYNVGSSDYDTSHKIRVPAWTDRILFKIDNNSIQAVLSAYEAIEDIESSDHKPVKAHLCLTVNNT